MLLPSPTFNTRSAHHSTGAGQWSNLQLGDTHPHRHRAHHHCLQVGRADLLGSVRAMKCWACAGWFGAASGRSRADIKPCCSWQQTIPGVPS